MQMCRLQMCRGEQQSDRATELHSCIAARPRNRSAYNFEHLGWPTWDRIGQCIFSLPIEIGCLCCPMPCAIVG
jgi:hypothetical protein